MAVVDTFTSIPDSALHNASIRAKFASTSLAGLSGLGDDSEGVPSDYVDPNSTTIDFGGGGFIPDPTNSTTTLQDPFGIYTNGNPAVGAAQPYVDNTGNMVIPSSTGGGWVYITPQGQTQTGGGALPPRGSGNTTPSQQAAEFQLYSTLIKGSLDIAKLIAIQPGTSQTPGQTIRQTPGFPVSAQSVGFNAAVGGMSSGTLLLLGLAAAFIFMQSNNRG